jgi:hypothetical protein
MRRTTASANSLSTHAGWYQVVGPALSVVAAAAAANLVAPGFLGLASSFRHAAIAVPHRFGSAVGSGRLGVSCGPQQPARHREHDGRDSEGRRRVSQDRESPHRDRTQGSGQLQDQRPDRQDGRPLGRGDLAAPQGPVDQPLCTTPYVAYLAAQRPRSWPLNRRSLSVGFAPRIGLGAGRACPGKRPPARKARRAAVARIGDAGAWPRLRSGHGARGALRRSSDSPACPIIGLLLHPRAVICSRPRTTCSSPIESDHS